MAASGSKSVSIVLVHGGFVDGSGWEGVHRSLTKDGFSVSVAQNPTVTALADDVAVVRRLIAAQKGRCCWWGTRTAAWW